MYRKKKRCAILAAVLTLCFILTACGAAEEKGISCEIGATNEGNMYTATIELPDSDWRHLTEKQRETVVDQCVDTVEFSGEEDDSAYEITGIEKDTKKRLFTYTGKDRKTTFIE